MADHRVFTDEFKLTHEFLGMMLGVTRPTLTRNRTEAPGGRRDHVSPWSRDCA